MAIVGNDSVAGITNGGSVSNSVAINEEIVAAGNLARVANRGSCSNNLAWVLTSMVLDGEKQPIPPDDDPNGTNTGLSTLKLQATYEGLGWDFTSTWAIQETESFPYLQIQTAPPHFTQSLKAGDTQLSGQCVEEGTVRVRVGDSLYTAQSEGNSWSVTVGALRAGDVVSVSVRAEGKMPSYPVYATVKLAGSGTEEDPYLVSTASDLQAVTEMEEEDAYYLMTNDIDLTEWIEDQNSGGGWMPVGGNNNAFTGTFDGEGHTVSGLWTQTGSWNNGGLFAFCASGGTIRNLNVETVSGKTVYGTEYSGGIAGRNAGSIEQCTINGTVSGSKYVGGIVGSNSGSVSSCRFVGDVSSYAGSSYAGGIAGWNEETVTVCKTEGRVSSAAQSARVGGIVGYNSGSTSEVSDCESLMAVEASGSSAYGGGVAGYNYGSVTRCIATGDVTGYSVAGVCGYNSGSVARVTACVAANRSITATKGGLRVLGGYSSGGQAPGMEENYALKTMSVSVNGVPQVIYDDPLNGTAKTEDVLKQTALYERMSWSMDDIWGIDESNSFPYLRTHVVMVSKVDIDMDDAVMEVGDNVQFTATVLPEDARNSTVKWSSSKPEVAEVTEDGKVKALSAGTAVIKAVAADGSGASDSCRVTVNPKKAEKVTIDRSEVVIEIASVCKLSATVEPEYAADRSVTWQSSDSGVAKVDAEGTVTAVSVGTAMVTAMTNDGTDLSASCVVTVIPKRVKSITLDREELTLERDASERLTVTVLPEDAGDRSVTWQSSDEDIVTVDAEGVVTAISAGTATVTATTNDGTDLTASCIVTVTPKYVRSISLDREELTLERGASEQLMATVLPDDADDRSVTWESSDERVVTVDTEGVVTAVSAGTATVTATTNDGTDLTASCVVIITPKYVRSISLDREELTLERGASERLTATVYPMDADDRSVTWTSSDENVVTVNAKGTITAVSVGTAMITATTNDGSDLSASCEVTVVPKRAESISLDHEKLILERGMNERLTAMVYPMDADDRSVTWTSSDGSVVTVDSEGVVTAVSAGVATVTATTNDGTNLSASCIVTVTLKRAESISLNYTEITVEDGVIRLTATVLPLDADDRSVTWTSSDEDVATVDAEGVVYVLSVGTTTVTATTNDGSNLSASCVVTVAPKRAESISLDRDELTLERGTRERLTATVYPATADDRSVRWTSSDEDVATVDAGGIVTAVSAGTVTVTAMTNDGTDLTASCVVSVTPKLAESISLDREELILERGASERLTATVYPATADDRSVRWTSSDEDVATVDAGGIVTAISAGTATVTATTNDGTDLSASCIVTVSDATAVDNVTDNPIQVYGRNGEIILEGLTEGMSFYVYDVIGRRIYYGSENIVKVTPRAYYLVQVEDSIYKVYVP